MPTPRLACVGSLSAYVRRMQAPLSAAPQPFGVDARTTSLRKDACANPRTGKELSEIVAELPHLTNVGGRLSESALTVRSINGRTRLTRALAVPPVQLVHPRIDSRSALVFSSALGGGMLEGDDYRLDLRCEADATLIFAPQANTRIFPCPRGIATRNEIRGTVSANALVVCGGDPVVLHAGSRFVQEQNWRLHDGARLVLCDWMVVGRLERGEAFAFDTFESTTRIEDACGRLLLSDPLRLETRDGSARSGMGGFSSHLALHVVGPGWEEILMVLETWLRSREGSAAPEWMQDVRLAGIGIREGRGFSLRALGRDRTALNPLVDRLFAALAHPRWLGYDFWARKY